MSHSIFHVVRESSGGWVVKRSAKARVATASTKEEAIRKARDVSRRENGELIIHERSGRIVDRHVTRPATAKSIKLKLRRAYAKR